MQIPAEVQKCVFFVGHRKNGNDVFGGTGFFFTFLSLYQENFDFPCLVTAKHNIERIRLQGSETVLVRVSAAVGGTKSIETRISDWKTDPSDPFLDVAVLPFDSATMSDIDALQFPSSMQLTRDTIAFEPIACGDEVFFPGLFTSHYGAERNVPIVRTGSIAAMSDENVPINWFGTRVGIEAFLIEARSIGGLSGSPAFVHVGMHRFREKVDEKGRLARKVVTKPNRFYFMGLVHGHFDARSDEQTEKINSGIAIVVPVWKVLQAIEACAPKLRDD